ncbi:MAG: DNA-directed RNA polymerase subunit beta', partial [Clostridia bacterium]|nr:DNA-directed RNA polymerase subunit beta' [Clostridia bacterium]
IMNKETGEERSYLIPYGASLRVHEGDFVHKGDELTRGASDPQDILRVKGEDAVREYIIQEIQKVYNRQGVDISYKHIQVIVSHMLRKDRVLDPGDTGLLTGSVVDRPEVYHLNLGIARRNEEEGLDLKPATVETVLLGITKSALATESFLSAASFQETTKILTEAAIKGKTDHLIGLKENVIIGKLIPAGTGLERYRNVNVEEKEEII